MRSEMTMEIMNELDLPLKMRALIADLYGLSKLLQRAIIRRDSLEIGKILSSQGEKLALFEAYKSEWAKYPHDNPWKKNNDEIEMEIGKLREVNKSTETLIRAFMTSIRKSLKDFSPLSVGDNMVYSANGKMKNSMLTKNVSVLG